MLDTRSHSKCFCQPTPYVHQILATLLNTIPVDQGAETFCLHREGLLGGHSMKTQLFGSVKEGKVEKCVGFCTVVLA